MSFAVDCRTELNRKSLYRRAIDLAEEMGLMGRI